LIDAVDDINIGPESAKNNVNIVIKLPAMGIET